MKKIEGHFWSPSNPSTRPIRPPVPLPIKLGASRLAVRVSTGPRRDIVGILVLLLLFLYKPIRISKIHSKILNHLWLISQIECDDSTLFSLFLPQKYTVISTKKCQNYNLISIGYFEEKTVQIEPSIIVVKRKVFFSSKCTFNIGHFFRSFWLII